MNTALLIDANNMIMSSLYAMRRSELTAHGVCTGPLMVTVNRIARLVRDEQPTRLLLAFDGGRSIHRLGLDPEYKAHRTREPLPLQTDTFGLLADFADKAGLGCARIPGEEADDLIAGAWQWLTPQEADKIVIVSADKDLSQLLGPNPCGVTTEQIRLGSSNPVAATPTDRWTAERFTAERGYRPDQLARVMALTGDKVDGVKGVPGIGPVKALALLREHDWSLPRVAAAVAQRDAQAARRIEVDHRLVDLRTERMQLPVPTFRPVAPLGEAGDRLAGFLRHYELADIEDRWRSGRLWRQRGKTIGRSWVNVTPLTAK